jgi:hypothetical protein
MNLALNQNRKPVVSFSQSLKPLPTRGRLLTKVSKKLGISRWSGIFFCSESSFHVLGCCVSETLMPVIRLNNAYKLSYFLNTVRWVRFEVSRQSHDDRLLGRVLICTNLFGEPIACILRVDIPTKLQCVTLQKTVMYSMSLLQTNQFMLFEVIIPVCSENVRKRINVLTDWLTD